MVEAKTLDQISDQLIISLLCSYTRVGAPMYIGGMNIGAEGICNDYNRNWQLSPENTI